MKGATVRSMEARERMDKQAARLKFDFTIRICERAEKEIKGWKSNIQRSSFVMDLDSIPELDLERLLKAPKFDFAHDCCGIVRHMDRRTYPGKLTNCFWPRCCRNENHTGIADDL